MHHPIFEDHFAAATPVVRERLEQIAAIVEQRLPDAQQCISYRMPAYRLGRVFFFFAAFKNHIGIYPPVAAPAQLVSKLAEFRGPKGNLIFHHNKPIPLALIGQVAEQLARQAG